MRFYKELNLRSKTTNALLNSLKNPSGKNKQKNLETLQRNAFRNLIINFLLNVFVFFLQEKNFILKTKLFLISFIFFD
jgi:hypothetical protein